jgi:hypothetical protein
MTGGGTADMVDALRGQQAELRRLLAQKVLIGDALKTTLSEMQALVIELRRLLAELEGPFKTSCSKAVSSRL